MAAHTNTNNNINTRCSQIWRRVWGRGAVCDWILQTGSTKRLVRQLRA